MFKKLKDKIAEQSPLKLTASVQQFAQAVVNSTGTAVPEPVTLQQQLPVDPFSIGDEETPQNSPARVQPELHNIDLHDTSMMSSPSNSAYLSPSTSMYASPLPSMQFSGTRSRRSSIGSATSEASSIFGMLDVPNSPPFHLQSDWESTASEGGSGAVLEAVSKEQLLTAYRTIQGRYHKYKGRYTDLVRHYKQQERDLAKTKSVLASSQDKALRRISELKEQCQLEQRAKAHLEEALRNDLEEKDITISTLRTKLSIMKPGDDNGPETLANNNHAAGQEDLQVSQDEVQTMRDRIATLENMQGKFREALIQYKERAGRLAEEKSQVEKERDSVKVELATLEEQVSGLRRQEEEASRSLAENKQQIHVELEAREMEVQRLQSSLASISVERDQLAVKARELQEGPASASDAASPPADLGELQRLLEVERQARDASEAALKQREEELSAAQQELRDTASKVLESSSQLEAAQNNASLVQQQLQHTLEQLRERDSELKCMRVLAKDLETSSAKEKMLVEQVKQLQQQVEQLKSDLVCSSENISKLQDQERELTEENKIYKSEVQAVTESRDLQQSEHEQTCLELREKCESLERQLEQSTVDQVTEIDKQYKIALEANKMSENYEIKNLQGTVQSLEQELNKLKASKKSTEVELNEICEKLKTSELQITNLTSQKSEVEKSYEEHLRQLRETNNALEATSKDQTTRVTSLEEENQEFRKKLDDAVCCLGESVCDLDFQGKLHALSEHTQQLTLANRALVQEKDSLLGQLTDNQAAAGGAEQRVRSERDKWAQELAKCNSDKEEISGKYKDIQLQFENVITQLASTTSEKNELQSMVQTLEIELNKIKPELTDLKSNVEVLINTNNRLESCQSELNSENNTLRQENSELANQLDVISNVSKNLQSELENAKRSLQDDKHTLELLQTEVQKNKQFEHVVVALEEKLRSAEHHVEALQAEAQVSRSSLEEVTKLNAELRGRDTSAERRVAELEETVQILHSEAQSRIQHLEEFRTANETLKLEIQTFEKKIGLVEKDKQVIQSELERYKEENRNIVAQVENEKSRGDELNSLLQQAALEKNNSEEQLRQSQILINNLTSQVQEQTDLAAKQEISLKENKLILKQLEQEIEGCRTKYETQLSELYNELEEKRSEIKALKTETLESSARCETLEANLSECQNNYQSQLNPVKDELHKYREDLKTCRIAAKEFKKKFESVRSELEESKSKYEVQLESLLHELELARQQRDEHNAGMKKVVEDNKLEMSQLQEKLIICEEKYAALLQSEQSNSESNVTALQQQIAELRRAQELELETTRREQAEELVRLREELTAAAERHDAQVARAEQQQHVAVELTEELQGLRQQLATAEEEHDMQIKLVVRDYEAQLARKEQDYQDELDRTADKEEKAESLNVRQLREQVRDLKHECKDMEQAHEDLTKTLQDSLRAAEASVEVARQAAREEAQGWQRRLEEAERWAREQLDTELQAAEAKHREHVEGLAKEWQFERKSSDLSVNNNSQELERTSQLAVAAMESSAASAELLQRQLMAQAREMVQLQSPGQELDPALQLAYLRNVLYEYMMGKQPLVLAKVIAAVAKFDSEQTSRVLQKEEQKQTLLGQMGLI